MPLTSEFTLFHGVPSTQNLADYRDIAPGWKHGAEWLPYRMTGCDEPWILDNGAYNNGFDEDEWLSGIETAVRKMPRPPVFVVLPDVYGDWDKTVRRHREYRDNIPSEWDCAIVAQPGSTLPSVHDVYVELDASAVFVGGGAWKRSAEGRRIIACDDYHVHVGEPRNIAWCIECGADTVDTTRYSRGDRRHLLREDYSRAVIDSEQNTLSQYSPRS